jgi:hypothetical protein
MLKKDGRWFSPIARLKVWFLVLRFMANVVPNTIKGMMPWHNPAHEKDLQWVSDWIKGYTKTDKNFIPLVDTSHSEIPTPFTS